MPERVCESAGLSSRFFPTKPVYHILWMDGVLQFNRICSAQCLFYESILSELIEKQHRN
jgi:hypothetical protein